MRKRNYRLFNQANDGAAGGGGGGDAGAAPAAAAPAAPASAAAAAPAPAAAPNSQNSDQPWTQSIADEALRQYAEGKGFKTPADAAKALQDLEGKHAAPADAAAYQLPVPQGDDGKFAQVASGWFQKAGLNVAQAQAVASQWNEFQTAQAQAQQAESARQVEALKGEWGTEYTANVETARKAMKAFGVGTDMIDKIAGQMGDAATIKLFSTIGKSMSESTLNPGAGASSTTAPDSDPEAARASRMFPSMRS